MKVNKVAGNFHMTLGESIVRDGAHIHQFVPSEAKDFNVSHTIHSLSFGERYDSMAPNPLDSGNYIPSLCHMQWSYFDSKANCISGAGHWIVPVFHQSYSYHCLHRIWPDVVYESILIHGKISSFSDADRFATSGKIMCCCAS